MYCVNWKISDNQRNKVLQYTFMKISFTIFTNSRKFMKSKMNMNFLKFVKIHGNREKLTTVPKNTWKVVKLYKIIEWFFTILPKIGTVIQFVQWSWYDTHIFGVFFYIMFECIHRKLIHWMTKQNIWWTFAALIIEANIPHVLVIKSFWSACWQKK